MNPYIATIFELGEAAITPFDLLAGPQMFPVLLVGIVIGVFIFQSLLKKYLPISGVKRFFWFLGAFFIPVIGLSILVAVLSGGASDILGMVMVGAFAIFLFFILFFLYMPLLAGLVFSPEERNLLFIVGIPYTLSSALSYNPGVSNDGQTLGLAFMVWFPLTFIFLPIITNRVSPLKDKIISSSTKKILGRVAILLFSLSWIFAFLTITYDEQEHAEKWDRYQNNLNNERTTMESLGAPNILAVLNDGKAKVYHYSFKSNEWTEEKEFSLAHIDYGDEYHPYEYRRISPSGKYLAVSWDIDGVVPPMGSDADRGFRNSIVLLNEDGTIAFSTSSTRYINRYGGTKDSDTRSIGSESVNWSPDGRFISWYTIPSGLENDTYARTNTCNRMIHVYDILENSHHVPILGVVDDFRWTSPSRIFYKNCTGEYNSYDLSTGINTPFELRNTQTFRRLANSIRAYSYHIIPYEDDKALVTASESLHWTDGNETYVIDDNYDSSDLRWTTDGKFILQDNPVTVYSADGKQKAYPTELQNSWNTQPKFEWYVPDMIFTGPLVNEIRQPLPPHNSKATSSIDNSLQSTTTNTSNIFESPDGRYSFNIPSRLTASYDAKSKATQLIPKASDESSFMTLSVIVSFDENPNHLTFEQFYDGDPGVDLIGQAYNQSYVQVDVNGRTGYRLQSISDLAGSISVIVPLTDSFLVISDTGATFQKGGEFDIILNSLQITQ